MQCCGYVCHCVVFGCVVCCPVLYLMGVEGGFVGGGECLVE